ncbi:MAG: efflux RND transporter periplasmic adaptor subunit [Saprospiraceae bacterium]
MKNLTILILSTLILVNIISCKKSQKNYDASGSFEAIERKISAEATGKIISLDIEEGQILEVGDTIGRIDISNLVLQSEQVIATMDALGKKTKDASPQTNVLHAQLATQNSHTEAITQQIKVIEIEIIRFKNLVNANAAPLKKLDDLLGQKSILEKKQKAEYAQANAIQSQIIAAKKNVNLQNRSILSEISPTQKRLDILRKQINDGTIISEHSGTITTQYAYDGEYTRIGRPLYKIADLSKIILRVYISGNQLAQVKLNDEVMVLAENGSGGMKEKMGIITWISSKGEFTPKTIQTVDERANMVYAIKIKITNDGTYKIGMYGEIKFKKSV